MKSNLKPASTLMTLAVIFCSFIVPPRTYPFSLPHKPLTGQAQTYVYMIYNDAGPQTLVSSYIQSSTGHGCPGSTRLCHIRVADPNNDGVISQAEFTPVFNTLDTDSDGTLNDETESAILQKKA